MFPKDKEERHKRELELKRDYHEGNKTRKIDFFESENGHLIVLCAEVQDEIDRINETERCLNERAEQKFKTWRDKNEAYNKARDEKERQEKRQKKKKKQRTR